MIIITIIAIINYHYGYYYHCIISIVIVFLTS